MAQRPSPGTILGEHGETLSRPTDLLADLNLPPGVQALIEARVSAAIEQLREDNRREVAELVRKNTRKWQVIAALSFIFTLISWFIAPQQIKKWSKDYVQKRMTAPELKRAADEAIRTQMGDYVRSQIEPVRQDISTKQEQLAAAQTSIDRQVQIQQFAIGAKAGGLSDYENLKRASAEETDAGKAAKAALKEVELYFDADRAQLMYPTLVDTESRQPPGWSYEEMLVRLGDKDPRIREAAVNVISQIGESQKSKGIVEELIQALQHESDLRVIARISRTLSILTKQEFKPLDRDAIASWWRLHARDPLFVSPYRGFKEGLLILDQKDNSTEIPKLIKLLDETLSADPDAVYTRALKMRCLLAENNLVAAAKESEEIEKRQGDFRWALVWKASLLERQGKTDEAVIAINAAFARSPELVKLVKADTEFEQLRANPKIVWPQKPNP